MPAPAPAPPADDARPTRTTWNDNGSRTGTSPAAPIARIPVVARTCSATNRGATLRPGDTVAASRQLHGAARGVQSLPKQASQASRLVSASHGGIAALHGLRWKRLWRHGGADPFSAFPALESSRLGTVP
ncbi:hypothetical protein ACCO45_012261 [Purpureocillium lilacinum]|uniref:Uncharacterized protein n=1 Tax=Purpureocillium lilacinum TaxID=33203 RepID=A0ACC4DG59_PURLI